MQARDIPNLISIARIILVIPVVWTLLEGFYLWSVVLFAVAGISDAVDGYLAKHYHWQSRLGGLLDPLADKLLLIATFLSLAWLGMISWWLVAVIAARDLVVIGGGLVYNWLIAPFHAEPSWVSKLSTTLQIVLGVAALFHLALVPLPAVWFDWLEGAIAVAVITSGLGYVLEWSQRAFKHGKS